MAKPDESGITLHCEQGRAAGAARKTSAAVIHTQFTCSFHAFAVFMQCSIFETIVIVAATKVLE